MFLPGNSVGPRFRLRQFRNHRPSVPDVPDAKSIGVEMHVNGSVDGVIDEVIWYRDWPYTQSHEREGSWLPNVIAVSTPARERLRTSKVQNISDLHGELEWIPRAYPISNYLAHDYVEDLIGRCTQSARNAPAVQAIAAVRQIRILDTEEALDMESSERKRICEPHLTLELKFLGHDKKEGSPGLTYIRRP